MIDDHNTCEWMNPDGGEGGGRQGAEMQEGDEEDTNTHSTQQHTHTHTKQHTTRTQNVGCSNNRAREDKIDRDKAKRVAAISILREGIKG